MSKPRLTLISDDQAIIDIGGHISAERYEQMKVALDAALRDKTAIVLAGEMGWDIVDKRQPDIEQRLAALEERLEAHLRRSPRKPKGFSPAVDGIDYDSSEQ